MRQIEQEVEQEVECMFPGFLVIPLDKNSKERKNFYLAAEGK